MYIHYILILQVMVVQSMVNKETFVVKVSLIQIFKTSF